MKGGREGGNGGRGWKEGGTGGRESVEGGREGEGGGRNEERGEEGEDGEEGKTRFSRSVGTFSTRLWCWYEILPHLIGLLSSTLPAVKIALLHYRALQRLRHQILVSSQGEYDRTAPLSNKCQEDLHWWLAHLRDANGHSPSADLTITTDASKTGWSATNQKLSTRGV